MDISQACQVIERESGLDAQVLAGLIGIFKDHSALAREFVNGITNGDEGGLSHWACLSCKNGVPCTFTTHSLVQAGKIRWPRADR
ncbi:MAG: hypothetical protein KAY24_06890 [Candidatus Eisenbacteria sp.]|nr:hypothetical protein [Candidatus Eisenbacteria bacterium]